MRKGTLIEQENRDRFTKLRSMLRRAWMRDPERLACIRDSRIEYKGDNKRQKWEYECRSCKGRFMQKDITVDHIIPSGTFLCDKDFTTFPAYLFCHRSNLQLLCLDCHKIKGVKEKVSISKRKLYPREEGSYRNMISRCHNPKATGYCYYGDKGIKVCSRWRTDFLYFLEDMGPRPLGTTLDRINYLEDYTPKNCRWATYIEQGRNTSGNNVIEYQNQLLCIEEWAEKVKIKANTIIYRLRRGWSIPQALGFEIKPKKIYNGRLSADDIIDIVNKINSGVTQIQCGLEYGMDNSQINRVFHKFNNQLHIFEINNI